MSALLVILVFLLTALMLLPPGRVAEVIVALLAHLLGSRLDRLGPRAARSLMWYALAALPGDQRRDQFDEWIDHLRAAGDDGLQSLVVAVGLIVRGLPRLAVRARTRQLFDVLVCSQATSAFAGGDGYKEQRWMRDCRTRVTISTMHYIGLIERWDWRLVGTFTVFYDIDLEPHQEPVISREVYLVSNSLQRMLVWLAVKLGCQASARRRVLEAVPPLLESGLVLSTDSLGVVDALTRLDSLFDTAVKKSNGLLYADRPR